MSDKKIPIPAPDNVPKPQSWWQKLRQNKQRLWVAILFAVVLLLILICAIAGINPIDRVKQLWHGGKQNTYGTISFDGHTTNSYAAYNGGLAIGTISGLFLYDLYGEETKVVQNGMTTPSVQTGKDSILACDVGGSAICISSKEKDKVLNKRLEGTILDADIANDDSVCYALSTKTCKTQLVALDKDQNEIYRWNSETAFFNQCCISPSATYLAGIRIGQTDNAFESTVVLFKTTEKEPIATLSLGNDLFVDLDFLNNTTLCAVGENALHFFTSSGKEEATYDYSDTYLTHYDLHGDGFIALATNKNKAGGNFVLRTLDANGKELATLDVKEEILDISASGSYLAVLTTSGLTIYNARLKVSTDTTQIDSASQVIARDDGSALLICGNKAVLFRG